MAPSYDQMLQFVLLAFVCGLTIGKSMTRLFAGTQFDLPPTCDLCGQVESECGCSAAQKQALADQQSQEQQEQERLAMRKPPGKQTARVRFEKRKGNRKVTVIAGLTHQANDLPALLATLQSACGAGGTVKSDPDLVELQGDQVFAVTKKLKEIGYKVK